MSDPSAAELLVERDGPIVTLRLNRPSKRNALNENVLRLLRETCDAVARDGSVRAVIVTGGERAFAAGADIGEFAAAPGVANAWRGSVGVDSAVFRLQRCAPSHHLFTREGQQRRVESGWRDSLLMGASFIG
jgi:enoyl-CoA hydratase/carnithine racemase